MTARIALGGEIEEATFLERMGRFTALVEREGRSERVYLPNSGRLRELLIPGRRVILAQRPGPGRQTSHDLVIVSLEPTLVWVDARTPSRLVSAAVEQGDLPRFKGYSLVRLEYPFGGSRLDLLLGRGGRECLVEVKSVTLVRGGTALFPDAPTQRGSRHLRVLAQAVREGREAAVIFVVQREDARSFSPNDEIDPKFGQALRRAATQGVEVHAYRCQARPREIRLAAELPVHL